MTGSRFPTIFTSTRSTRRRWRASMSPGCCRRPCTGTPLSRCTTFTTLSCGSTDTTCEQKRADIGCQSGCRIRRAPSCSTGCPATRPTRADSSRFRPPSLAMSRSTRLPTLQGETKPASTMYLGRTQQHGHALSRRFGLSSDAASKFRETIRCKNNDPRVLPDTLYVDSLVTWRLGVFVRCVVRS